MTFPPERDDAPQTTRRHAPENTTEGPSESALSATHEVRNPDLVDNWTGPVPSPEVFAQYAEISPDFPERIIQMLEDEAAFRKREYEQQSRIFRRGQVMAFFLLGLMLVLGFVSAGILLSKGEETLAFVITTTQGLLALVVSAVGFYFGRRDTTRGVDK